MKPLENQKIKIKEQETMAEQPQGIVFTPEMLENLIATVMQKANEQTLEAVREMKKPSAREQEKLDKEIEQENKRRVARAKEAVQDERARRTSQFYCSHVKTAEGVLQRDHAFRGQVSNDNCCRAVCIRCTKVFSPFKVTQENMKSGMHLENLKTLTAESLWTAHIQSFPECKDCASGGCAVRDLREFKRGKMDELPTILPDGKVLAEQLSA